MKIYILFMCHDGDSDGHVIAVYASENDAIQEMNRLKNINDELRKASSGSLPMIEYYEVQSFYVN